MPDNLPQILDRVIIASSDIFQIEQQHLQFSNAQQRYYERIVPKNPGPGSVLIVPLHERQLVLIREYSAGLGRYTLGFPKGLIDRGETAIAAAGRELAEEAGYRAESIRSMMKLASSPGYLSSQIELFIAEQLQPTPAVGGDEPEPLEVIHWPLADADRLLQQDDFVDARSVAGLLWVLRKYAL